MLTHPALTCLELPGRYWWDHHNKIISYVLSELVRPGFKTEGLIAIGAQAHMLNEPGTALPDLDFVRTAVTAIVAELVDQSYVTEAQLTDTSPICLHWESCRLSDPQRLTLANMLNAERHQHLCTWLDRFDGNSRDTVLKASHLYLLAELLRSVNRPTKFSHNDAWLAASNADAAEALLSNKAFTAALRLDLLNVPTDV